MRYVKRGRLVVADATPKLPARTGKKNPAISPAESVLIYTRPSHALSVWGLMGTSWYRYPQFFLEWLTLRGATALVRSGDLEHAHAMTCRLARTGRFILRNDWSWANKNLQLVFGPALDPTSRVHLATLAFEHFFTSCMEAMRIRDFACHFIHRERLVDAFSKGSGVVLCSIHLGSWEPAAFCIASDFPTAFVFREVDNPWSEREFERIRSSYGVEWIPSRNIAAIDRAVRAGMVLILMSDINMRVGGVPSEFLGIPAMCPPGPASVAINCQCPIVPAVFVRENRQTSSIQILDAIDPPKRSTSAANIPMIIRKINAAFEPLIVQYAEQYDWRHPRWRSRPDGRLWSLSDPIESFWSERTAPFPSLPPRIQQLIGNR